MKQREEVSGWRKQAYDDWIWGWELGGWVGGEWKWGFPPFDLLFNSHHEPSP